MTLYLQDSPDGRVPVGGGFLSDGREPNQETQPTRCKVSDTSQRWSRVTDTKITRRPSDLKVDIWLFHDKYSTTTYPRLILITSIRRQRHFLYIQIQTTGRDEDEKAALITFSESR